MKELELRNQELWYTDNPLRCLEDLEGIREAKGTETLPPILVIQHRFEYDGAVKDYIIIEGNKRAFVDSENGRRTRAKEIENDEDLRNMINELPPEHGLKQTRISSLAKLKSMLSEWLYEHYSSGNQRLYGQDVV